MCYLGHLKNFLIYWVIDTVLCVCRGRLVEDGRMTEAEEMKQYLEQQQRDRLRPFTDGKAIYSPRWFMWVALYPLIFMSSWHPNHCLGECNSDNDSKYSGCQTCISAMNIELNYRLHCEQHVLLTTWNLYMKLNLFMCCYNQAVRDSV